MIYNGELSGGTKSSQKLARSRRKPYLMLDFSQLELEDAAGQAFDFIYDRGLWRINFSGPRGDTRGHLWLPWIDEDDRAALARLLGERVHHESESNESEYLPLLEVLDRQR